MHREISKINYRIHTDAVKEYLIPPELTSEQITFKYSSEADLLNVALFGITAKKWRDDNPDKKGNIRDYASLQQLLVLSNLESYNAALIEQGKIMSERLQLLRKMAIKQMDTISELSLDKLPNLVDKNEI